MIMYKDGKILLQKRKGSKLWPGYYALPAGHIDEGENQYEAVAREAMEELGITIDPRKIRGTYIVHRRNHFEIDGKILEPYFDFYFDIDEWEGEPSIMEPDKCDELIWVNPEQIPFPFINYEGAFLENRSITNYDCWVDGSYVPKLTKKE